MPKYNDPPSRVVVRGTPYGKEKTYTEKKFAEKQAKLMRFRGRRAIVRGRPKNWGVYDGGPRKNRRRKK